MTFDGGEMYPPAECLSSFSRTTTTKKKKKKASKRRFSDEQVQSLEVMFESESKLEQAKKLQLAKQLGLQPRQVAIWFQNKRARWKSKELQREFSILHNNYSSLASQFQALKKEKQSLLIQLQKLNDLLQKPGGERQAAAAAENCIGEKVIGAGEEEMIKTQIEESPISCLPFERSEQGISFLSDDASSVRADYLGQRQNEHPELEPELIRDIMVEQRGDHSLTTSSDTWGSLESDALLDDQCGSSSYQWWDFWSLDKGIIWEKFHETL